MLKTHSEPMAKVLKRLERSFQADVGDAGAIVAAQLVEPLANQPRRATRSSAGRLPEDDITNLLQEALEEDAADKKLTKMVVSLGLLLASLDSPRK